MLDGLNRLQRAMARVLALVLASTAVVDAHAALLRFEFSGQIRELIGVLGNTQDGLEALAQSDVVNGASFSGCNPPGN